MAWTEARPSSHDSLKDVPTIVQENLDAFEDGFGVEHYTFTTPSLSGRHKAGYVGIMYQGVTSGILALEASAGCLAYDTSEGILVFHDGSTWESLSGTASNHWERMRAYLGTSYAITADLDPVIFDTTDYSVLDCYRTGTGTYTASAAGVYLVVVSVRFSTSFAASGDYIYGFRIQSDSNFVGSISPAWVEHSSPVTFPATAYTQTMNFSTIMRLAAGNYVKVFFRAPEAGSLPGTGIALVGEASSTYFCVHRLGGQCI